MKRLICVLTFIIITKFVVKQPRLLKIVEVHRALTHLLVLLLFILFYFILEEK